TRREARRARARDLWSRWVQARGRIRARGPATRLRDSGHARGAIQEHAHRAVGDVDHGEVGLAVAVEITDRDRFGLVADAELDVRREAAVAQPDEDADVVRRRVRGHQVEQAVAVEI